jgi:hypothetical protein
MEQSGEVQVKQLMRPMLLVVSLALMPALMFAGPAAAAKGGNRATVEQCKQSVLAGAAFRNRGQCVSGGAKSVPPPRSGAAAFSFVSNNQGNSVTEYAKGANGNVAPVATISGPHTRLSGPRGLALERSGDLVVANQDDNSLTEYPPGATGDETPTNVIAGPQTGLNGPTGVAVDASGNLFVSNLGTDTLPVSSVTEYPAGSTGDIEPTTAIKGPATGLLSPTDVALDASGNILVTNLFNSLDQPTGGTVTEYARRSNGNVAPDTVIEGDQTLLGHPESLTIDPSGNVFVATGFGGNPQNDAVAEFAKMSNGNVAPLSAISGGATGLANATGVAVDSAGTVFVTNFLAGKGSVTTYASGATGNVAPATTVTGPSTGLDGPAAIALIHAHS